MNFLIDKIDLNAPDVASDGLYSSCFADKIEAVEFLCNLYKTKNIKILITIKFYMDIIKNV